MALLMAQAPGAAAQAGTPPPAALQIVILDGDQALNNVKGRTAREPIVQVEDENHKPVAGAVVLFTIHGDAASGAGGSFNSVNSFTATTGQDGVARATGFHPNGLSGNYTITAEASLGALTAVTVIRETNYIPPPNETIHTSVSHSFLTPRIIFLGGVIITTGIVVGIMVANQGNNAGTITPGSGTVGPPPQARRGLNFHFGR